MVWSVFNYLLTQKLPRKTKVALGCSQYKELLKTLKVAPKVAEHNLFMPTPYNSRELMFVNLLLIFIHEKQVVDILQKVIDSSQADRGHKDKPSSGTNT